MEIDIKIKELEQKIQDQETRILKLEELLKDLHVENENTRFFNSVDIIDWKSNIKDAEILKQVYDWLNMYDHHISFYFDKEFIFKEFIKFIDYRKQKTPRWVKERREKEKTFELNYRLRTWFSKHKKFTS